jgi:hypothetical protein
VLGKLFRHGVLVQACPRLLWEDRYLTGRAGISAIAATRSSGLRGPRLDAVLLLAGRVGMIMAGFVPISGYKCSKNLSGRPDLNRRPLDPQECIHIPATRSFPCFRRVKPRTGEQTRAAERTDERP